MRLGARRRDKHRLAADLPVIWSKARDHFRATPGGAGADLFVHLLGLIAEAGRGHGGSHAGHLVGEFPRERINDDEIDCCLLDPLTVVLADTDRVSIGTLGEHRLEFPRSVQPVAMAP